MLWLHVVSLVHLYMLQVLAVLLTSLFPPFFFFSPRYTTYVELFDLWLGGAKKAVDLQQTELVRFSFNKELLLPVGKKEKKRKKNTDAYSKQLRVYRLDYLVTTGWFLRHFWLENTLQSLSWVQRCEYFFILWLFTHIIPLSHTNNLREVLFLDTWQSFLDVADNKMWPYMC